MNITELLTFIKTTQQQELSVLEAKANDYANTNIFSNFEQTAIMCQLPVDKVFQVMCGIKFCRIVELTSGKTPKFESIDDTLLDFSNYIKLYRAYLTNKENNGDRS